jgi:hypothetical protein
LAGFASGLFGPDDRVVCVVSGGVIGLDTIVDLIH